VFERYGDVLKGFEELESKVVKESGEGVSGESNAGGKVQG
jgi:hypothetical protein